MVGSEHADKIDDGAIATRNGRIVFAGPKSLLPTFLAADEQIDCRRRWITPGLVDCHTHLVFAGSRAAEFEQRLSGVTYEEIARQGGGILSTVKATRAADEQSLASVSGQRLDQLIAEGVTTVEIKSGYGLSLDAERKQLRVARGLGQSRRVDVTTTFLGAHALPPEATSKDQYIDTLCNEVLPALAKESLVDAVDGFCEKIAFSPAQIDRLFKAAKSLGFPIKLHADQLSNSGGAMLAAKHDALSADHLEYVDENGIAAMALAGTTAVLLPGAFYFIRETKRPPVELFRQHRVQMAIATDCNPGTSPLTSLTLAMNMAATLFGLTVEECWSGVTREAARALGRIQDIGTLEVGKWCNLAIWDVDDPAEVVYRIGLNSLHTRIWRGQG